MRVLRDRRDGQPGTDEDRSDGPASHIAWVAETLASMPAALARSISTTQRIEPADVPTVRRLLPSLGERYGLRARLELDEGYVTIWFDRRTAKTVSD